jgi:hypothetical protein
MSVVIVMQPGGFDYSLIDATAADLAKRAAEKIRRRRRQRVTEIIEIGADLNCVEAAIGHGHFGMGRLLPAGRVRGQHGSR